MIIQELQIIKRYVYKLGSFQIVYMGYMIILFVNYEINQILKILVNIVIKIHKKIQ